MIDPAYIQVPGSAEGMLKVETIVQSGSGEALTKAELDHLATRVIDGAFQVHSTLGPGLLESVYEICLVHELAKMSIPVRRQVALPVQYDGVELEGGFRVDLLVADNLIVEIKIDRAGAPHPWSPSADILEVDRQPSWFAPEFQCRSYARCGEAHRLSPMTTAASRGRRRPGLRAPNPLLMAFDFPPRPPR
ncbi:MAG: GxxExxY protein [Burkholderiales bacterium]|nr:GxxExxY protein [Burkholderiales bacterium]